jgi:hypothetical protein
MPGIIIPIGGDAACVRGTGNVTVEVTVSIGQNCSNLPVYPSATVRFPITNALGSCGGALVPERCLMASGTMNCVYYYGASSNCEGVVPSGGQMVTNIESVTPTVPVNVILDYPTYAGYPRVVPNIPVSCTITGAACGATGDGTFTFDADAEDWASSTFSGSTTGGWIGTDGDPDSGCYEVNSFGLNTHVDYADWFGTFEDLGVPPGSTVTGITLTSVKTKIVEVGTFGGVGVGPFYLSEPDGTNIATLWAGRSSSTNETTWTESSGTEQTISLASDTAIRLQFFTSLDSGISTITMTARYDSIDIALEYV